MTPSRLGELARLKAPSLASVVARRIEDQVVGAGWPVGSLLGSEGDLLARFGISRAALREAVRILEHSGVATMRRGPGGGLLVAEPSRDALVAAIGVWYSYEGITMAETMELRRPLLAAAVALAAERIGAPDAEDLVARARGLGAHGRIRLHEPNAVDSHIGVLSGNTALGLFIDALGDLGVTRLRGGWAELRPVLSTVELDRIATIYRRLAAAVAAHEPAVAVAAAGEVHEMLADRIFDLREQGRRPPVSAARGKLAEQIAGAIRDDIERAGWPLGRVIGSEAELIERYRVSRAVLREAVRILEHHGAARAKRGPSGGLVVSAPDLEAFRRASRLYLQYEGVTSQSLSEVREVVEVAMVRTAAQRVTESSAARLRAAIEAEGARAAGDDPATSFLDFHSELADAAGNRLARLYVEVLSDLVPVRVKASQRSAPAMTAMSGAAHRAHARIVDAVAAGDADAAERRMRRHLRASVDVLQ